MRLFQDDYDKNDDDDDDAAYAQDEDVNGFLASAAGRKASQKKKVRPNQCRGDTTGQGMPAD